MCFHSGTMRCCKLVTARVQKCSNKIELHPLTLYAFILLLVYVKIFEHIFFKSQYYFSRYALKVNLCKTVLGTEWAERSLLTELEFLKTFQHKVVPQGHRCMHS